MFASRLAFRDWLSGGGAVDKFWQQFGYAENINFDDYMKLYKRTGIAKRIIDITVDNTWRTLPEPQQEQETVGKSYDKKPKKGKHPAPRLPNPSSGFDVFKKEFKRLRTKKKMFDALIQADRLACIGRYSVILLGVKGEGENADFSTELPRGNGIDDILYFKVFSENMAKISDKDLVTDPKSSRYMMPNTYTIDKVQVHHSRIIHVADDLIDDEIYGTPKLQAVYNYIHDLMKMLGSTAEAYRLNARPWLVFNTNDDIIPTKEAEEQMKRSLEEFKEDQSRFLHTQFTDVSALSPTISDPTNTINKLIEMISAGSNRPMRMLLGSEQGQLASTTDKDSFNSSITGRRETQADVRMLRVLIQRLVDYGYMSKINLDDINFVWKPLFEPTLSEKLQNLIRAVQAARQAVGSAGEVIGTIYTLEEIREMAGLQPDLPETKHKSSGNYDDLLDDIAGYEDIGKALNMTSNKRKRWWNRWINRKSVS